MRQPMSALLPIATAKADLRKTPWMKIFTREEGGYHHCQIDNQSICAAYFWDWLEQVLVPGQ